MLPRRGGVCGGNESVEKGEFGFEVGREDF